MTGGEFRKAESRFTPFPDSCFAPHSPNSGMEAAVNVSDLPGDAGGEVAHEKGCGVAHVFRRYVAPQRGVVLDEFQYPAEAADAGGRKRLDRSRGDAVDPDAPRPEVLREVAHGGLTARLFQPHTVVVR